MAQPLARREMMQLRSLGIDPANCKFGNVTTSSDKYIAVQEPNTPAVAVVETQGRTIMRLPLAADSAIMNPVSRIIAFRVADKANANFTNMQIYNLDIKSKVKTCQLTSPVRFWKWLDPKTIAIVTPTHSYHWSLDGTAQPVQVFARAEQALNAQIINYRSSADGKWLLCGGIVMANNAVNGLLQVYSVDLKASQPVMPSHAACFVTAQVDGRPTTSNLFCFTLLTPSPKFNVMELGVPREQALKRQADLPMQPGDFPMSMAPDDKWGMVYILTKMGQLIVYEVQSGTLIVNMKASDNFVSASSECGESGGLVTVDITGRVCKFDVDEKNLVSFVTGTLNNTALGIQLSSRFGIGGEASAGLFQAQFRQLVQGGRTDEAIALAAKSPGGALRNVETINIFKQLDPSGQVLLKYFQTLMNAGTQLNAIESVELVKLVMTKNAQQGAVAVQNWLQEPNKLTPSEDLGDLLKNVNIKLALSVYVRSNVHEKVISCFLSMGAQAQDDATALENFNNVLNYAIRVSFSPDYPLLVSQLLRVQPSRAKDFALLLLNHPDGAKLEINQTVGLFIQMNDVKNTTDIILKYLRPRGDLEEDAQLQTQVLEINLRQGEWEVVQAIFDSPDYNWSHYDRMHIARLSEQGGLFQFALDHYTDINDVKRVMHNAARMEPLFQFLVNYFGRLEAIDAIDILRDLLRASAQRNLKLVVAVSRQWAEKFGVLELLKVLEEFQAFNGVWYFLKDEILNATQDPVVVFKFIEAATLLGQLGDLEAVCRDHQHYDAKEVKEFLISRNLKDPRPLIHVCDRNGFVEELTQYLYQNNLEKFLLAYVQRLNTASSPVVLGTLLDMNAPEEFIRNLMAGVRPPVGTPGAADFVTRLVAECEKRNRLKLLRTWIEERVKEGSQDPPLHSGLAKIYIELNLSPQQFLRENQFYEARVVGQFCESRDPHLAMIVYRRAAGECDADFLRVSSENGLFKDQARYLVEQQNNDLWMIVLAEENQYRRQVIDQVVATALPECNNADRVSNTVKAFMAANLPNELIELLERLIIHGSSDGEFTTNTNLQNLLILTAIKADTKRVQGYADRLQHYDGPDIAKIALSDDYKLYEEAFFIFKKFKRGEEAIQVLLDQLDALDRAQEFAEYWDNPEDPSTKQVWSILGKAQLDRLMVKEAISSFLKADDATFFQQVIFAAKNNDCYNEMITFLSMARQKTRDASLDNELVYAYARTERLTDLEEFIIGSHMAKLSDVGDMCFNEALFHAAKILFKQTNNNAKLAVCLVKLDQFDEAVDAARQASQIGTWKAVCFSCVDAGKFTLAARCGINIIVMMEHMNELVKYYEQNGHFDELIQLLEQGLNLDRVHQGIYTMLGVMYSRHKEEKLMDHIKFFYQKLNMTTLLQECRRSMHWQEVVFLYSHWDQYDNAVDTMITHAADCWDNKHFKELCLQANSEVSYRAIDFYIEEHPLLLNELLSDLATKLEAGRVVHKLRQANHLPLIKSYLLNVQRDNLVQVNEAVNQILLDEDDFKGLRDSVNKYSDFDQIALAQKIERHELLEFRRIAAYLYRLNKKFNKSIEVCKADEMWQDATETAAESKSPQLAEGLLRFFVAEGNSASFAATMYACYDLLRADIIMELAWRNGLMDVAMPFMIQTVFDYNAKLGAVTAKLEAMEKKQSDEEAARAAMEEEEQELYNPVIATNLLAPPPGMGMGGGNMMGGGMGMDNGMMGGGMGMDNGMGMGGMGGMPMGGMGGMY